MSASYYSPRKAINNYLKNDVTKVKENQAKFLPEMSYMIYYWLVCIGRSILGANGNWDLK